MFSPRRSSLASDEYRHPPLEGVSTNRRPTSATGSSSFDCGNTTACRSTSRAKTVKLMVNIDHHHDNTGIR